MRMLKRSMAASHGFALVVVAAALGLRALLSPFLGDGVPFITLFPAVALVAWFGGRSSAMLATFLGAAGVAYFFSGPTRDYASPHFAAGLVLFVLFAMGSVLLIESLRRVSFESQSKSDLLQITMASIGDGVIVTDANHRITRINPVAERLTGYSSREALGKPMDEVFNIVNESTREPVEIPSQKALETRDVVALAGHTILIGKEGNELAIDDTAAPIIDQDGTLIGSVLVFRDVTERRSKEKVFHDSFSAARLLASIIESSEDAIITKDLSGIVQSWNEAAERLYGYEASEIVGKPITILIPERLRQEEAEIIARLREGQRINSYETVRLTKDGREIPVSLTISPIRDESGTIIGASKIARDISDRKIAEQRLGISEDRLSLALEAGRMGVWDWDVAQGKLSWTDHLEPLHGLEPGTFGGTVDDFVNLVHPLDRDNVLESINAALESGSEFSVQFRTIHPGNVIRWIAGLGKVYRDPANRPYRMLGLGFDITERYRSEKSAQFLSSASAALADVGDLDSTLQRVAALSVPDFADWAAIDVVEADGLLRRVAVAHVQPEKVRLAIELHRRFPPNPDAQFGTYSVLRTGKPDMVRQITDDLLVANITDSELLEIARDLGLKSFISVPLRVRGKTFGVITYVSAESGHLYDEVDLGVAEELSRRAGIAIENSQLYGELRSADRKKDEFLATLAHELRNPLAPMQNSLDLLKMVRDDEAARHVAIDTMQRQVAHMSRLIDDLMDVGRITTGKLHLKLETVDIRSIVDHAVESYGGRYRAGNHKLTIVGIDEPIHVKADSVRLSQAIGNLVDNASKYTPDGGDILIKVGVDDQQAVVKVIDNGLGIPEGMLGRIFELFAQVEGSSPRFGGGLGIGLSLASRLIEMHGGSVIAESGGIGKGSTFTIRLPLAEPTSVLSAESAEAQSGVQGRRILVVDDNHDISYTMSLLLSMRGNEVQVAYSGEEALEVAKIYNPEAVLLDIGLPGMDGYDTCRALRQTPNGSSLAIIALTGWGQDEDRRRSREAGFDSHLVKPVNYDDVAKLMDSILSSK